MGRLRFGPYLVSAALFVVIGVAIYNLQSVGISAAAIAMSKDMDMRNMGKFWAFPFLQSSGLIALLFSYISVLLGLSQTILKERGYSKNIAINCLHRHVALSAVILVVIHMITTALDAMGDSWRTVLIPGAWADQGWPEAVWGYDLGIAAAYLLVLVGPTFYLRRYFSGKNWINFHRLIAFVYLFSVWHAMILGLDLPYYTWLRPAIWLAQIPVLALFMWRLYRSTFKISSAEQQFSISRLSCVTGFVFSALAILTLLIIVVTGNSGFIATV